MKKKLVLTVVFISLLIFAIAVVLIVNTFNKDEDSVDFGPRSELKDTQNQMTLKYPESMDVYDTYLNTEEGTKDIFFRFKEDASPEPVGLVLRVRKEEDFTGFSKYCEEQKNIEIPEECYNTAEALEQGTPLPECNFPEYWCSPEFSSSTTKINGIEWEVPGERSVTTRNGELVLYSTVKDGKVYTMMSRSESPVYLESAKQIIESIKFSKKKLVTVGRNS